MNDRRQNKLPKTLSEKRIRSILAHYDRQTEDEVAAEIEAAFESPGHAILAVPLELLGKVRKLVAKQKSTKPAQPTAIPKMKHASNK